MRKLEIRGGDASEHAERASRHKWQIALIAAALALAASAVAFSLTWFG